MEDGNNTVWDHERVLNFINLYQEWPELWNHRNKNYHLRNKKQDAWESIAAKIKCDVDTAKTKMNSLLSSFRREKAKITKSTGTGKGRTEIYTSNWFAFKSFFFLLDKSKPMGHTNTENITVEEEENDSGEEQLDEFIVEATTNETIEESNQTQNEEIAGSQIKSQTREKHKLFASSKKAQGKKKSAEDPRVAYAFDVLQKISSKQKDESATFADHIGTKLRKFDDITRTTAMHRINNVLFQIELEYYGKIAQAQQGQQQQQQHYMPLLSPSPSTSAGHPPSSPAAFQCSSSYSAHTLQDQQQQQQQQHYIPLLSPSPSTDCHPPSSPAAFQCSSSYSDDTMSPLQEFVNTFTQL